MTLSPPLELLGRQPLPLRLLVLAVALALLAMASSVTFTPGPPSFATGLVLNLGHLPLYGLLSLALLALAGPRPRLIPALLWLPAGVLLAGVLDEWHQATVAERTSSLLDLGSDLLAAWLVLALAAWERRSRRAADFWNLLGLGLALALYWDVCILLSAPCPLPWTPVLP